MATPETLLRTAEITDQLNVIQTMIDCIDDDIDVEMCLRVVRNRADKIKLITKEIQQDFERENQ